ncbi:hypothetical protein [Aeromonas media]|uniref:hypothetical protein n=1 Tax=Aeromonas media TaxID=651 RepID=UPI0024C1E777|nr:hypothetical protein [Aeromonas media]MDM5075698.1 hypothetical protein [Aeromonas media]
MSRVIPEEGDKGRGEPAPDHHQGPAELSTRRWYPEQPYLSRPDNSMGRIKKWPLPRIIVIDRPHIADFNPIPPDILSSPICSASIPPIITDATPSTGGTSPIFSPITINVGPSIAAPQQGNPGALSHGLINHNRRQRYLKLLIVLKIVHSDQVLGKRAEKPFFRGVAG